MRMGRGEMEDEPEPMNYELEFEGEAFDAPVLQEKLLDAEFFNAFEDDFDEEDMSLPS